MTEPTYPLDADGVWAQRLRERPLETPRPALFLDRDGVVAVEVNYLHKPEDARLESGAADLIIAANNRDIPVVFVTNQAGIGYGYYGWPDFAAVQDRLLADLSAKGATVDAVLACPYHKTGKPPYQHPNHPCRKPNPGMLTKAGDLLGLDMGRSWIIGDRASDLEAGKRAGLAGGLQVLTGHGRREGETEACLALDGHGYQVLTAPTLTEAMKKIPLVKAGN